MILETNLDNKMSLGNILRGILILETHKKIVYPLYCVYLLLIYITHVIIFYSQNFTYNSYLIIFSN